nr:SabA family sialic acid-binding adhesin [Helicobacter acinonychis]
MVKNTGTIKRLSDTYKNLNNLLDRFNKLNWAVTNASSTTSINGAINNLNEGVKNLTQKHHLFARVSDGAFSSQFCSGDAAIRRSQYWLRKQWKHFSKHLR